MAEAKYDLLVIGAGGAGSSAVTTVDKSGKRVALVERNLLGGTCLNYGCDPTKTLLHTAHLLYQSQHIHRYGLRIPTVTFEWKDVQASVQQVITRLRGGTLEEAQAHLERQGIELLHGEATFISPNEVLIAQKIIFAKQIIIATGCETIVPPIEGLKEAGFITNVQAVALPSLPPRLAVIGGGTIGLEFAQLFHRFGAQVTVLERGSTFLDKEDRELAGHLCEMLTKEGICGELAARNAFAQEPQPFDDRVIPWVTFTSPALAHVGKTEEQLHEDKVEYRVAHLSLDKNERAMMMGENEGSIKLLVDTEGKILGGHILASEGDNLLAPIVLAMQANIPITTLASTLQAYPTLAEGIRQAASLL
jgi:pyruvate/2-oxoglutarate dehydrogenase complex dihydrolipoamide dehydrogenase (E3) component